ncbi:winged helix-turn-helix domain-containing protein [Methanococcus aeolicus]|uniref:winged helix-turn-helix domain-containing protein n=1 Tax=Methanococcus aeolicus TaxID=42879 RepID=UPI0021C7BAC9|nr:winged helix-turn-helix domain-containing protein [Methanococcus aeolicus]UXM84413.1 winged helix-turn-helix domain-containing protein [Methanococcus aeolicus]
MIIFKILSSKTKLDILELLSKRGYTTTELSKYLNKSKSTISEHLTQLSNYEFVSKEENNNKWKYYKLTNKGKLFLEHIEAMKITFGSGIFIIIGYYSYNYIHNTFKILGAPKQNYEMTSTATKSCKTNEILESIDSMDKSAIVENITNATNATTTNITNNLNSYFFNDLSLILGFIIFLIIIYFLSLFLIRRFGANRTI